jgi:hypothetical protein
MGESMGFDWLTSSNPVAIWWAFLVTVSIVNIALWLSLNRWLGQSTLGGGPGALRIEPLLLLSAAYVFGCAFRGVLPRADVERICLFDTWLSSVMVGRSVATVAEVCFAAQWAIILRHLAHVAPAPAARAIANSVVPVIAVAECCSWYAVITTDYLGNTIENSLWAVTFLGIAAALALLLYKFTGLIRLAIVATIVGIMGYGAFMATVDVPMYFWRWQADLANGKELLSLFAGLHDASTRWVVTHDIAQWRDEIAWLSLYFSVAVWTSLALCGFVLMRNRLPQYRVRARRLAPRRLSARPGAA